MQSETLDIETISKLQDIIRPSQSMILSSQMLNHALIGSSSGVVSVFKTGVSTARAVLTMERDEIVGIVTIRDVGKIFMK